MKLLDIKNIEKALGGQKILKNISFDLNKGDILGILGASGSGKSTILHCIIGFLEIDKGEIIINGKIVSSKTTHIKVQNRNIGILFQDYALFPHLNVEKNILFGISKLSKEKQQKRLDELLELIDLKGYEKRYPHELSGGQIQRVALARSLAPKPEIILLDEPFSSLNEIMIAQMRRDLKEIAVKNNLSIIIVTHNKDDVYYLCNRVALIKNGFLLDIGTPKHLYDNPKNIDVASFLGKVSFLDSSKLNLDSKVQKWLDSKNGLIRSNELKICSYDDCYFKATIEDNIYYGSNIELTLKIEDQKVLVTEDKKYYDIKIGETIYLKPSQF